MQPLFLLPLLPFLPLSLLPSLSSASLFPLTLTGWFRPLLQAADAGSSWLEFGPRFTPLARPASHADAHAWLPSPGPALSCSRFPLQAPAPLLRSSPSSLPISHETQLRKDNWAPLSLTLHPFAGCCQIAMEERKTALISLQLEYKRTAHASCFTTQPWNWWMLSCLAPVYYWSEEPKSPVSNAAFPV